MRQNEVKRKLHAGEVVIGCLVGIPSAEVVEICGFSGYDFVIIDAEHGPITTETAYHMILAAEVSGTVPLIRVPQNDPKVILRHMDIGAAGVMVPQINSAAEARAVVDAVKYHPQGRRGMAGVRAARYGIGQTLTSYSEAANRETIVMAQIENIAGVERVPEILGVPGIDVLYVGPADLAQSMGYPGQVDHPDVLATIERICEMCRGANVALGNIAATADAANRLVDQGFRMISVGASALLASASLQYLTGVKR